jgi:hypothetical protein
MPADDSAPAPQRDPRDEDLKPILDLIWEGLSLRKVCARLGLHVPSTSDWLHADKGREEQYARARAGRGEFILEDAHDMARAAALRKQHEGSEVDPAGVRVYLDAAKWRVGQMAPKLADVKRIDLTSRTRQMTDEEIATELAAMEGEGSAEG